MSAAIALHAEDYRRRRDDLAGWPIGVESYKLGSRWLCAIDNVDPGAVVARGEGASREEAESRALEAAARRLGRTRIHDGPEG